MLLYTYCHILYRIILLVFVGAIQCHILCHILWRTHSHRSGCHGHICGLRQPILLQYQLPGRQCNRNGLSLVVLRVCAWISHWNCECSLARLFSDVPKTTSTIEQFAHGCKFLWIIIAAQNCSAPHPLPDPLLIFAPILRSGSPSHQCLLFGWKLPWEANISTISNLNQWSVLHWCSTILWAPYELWKHILYADDSLESKELSKPLQLWTMHEHHQHR